mmetsp:Transcript_38601/g.44933  ORF Transcript_38601/g.44933 Transcript_38601/m.44933 type:complete len:80 (+) Transcript_38601:136-375(+)
MRHLRQLGDWRKSVCMGWMRPFYQSLFVARLRSWNWSPPAADHALKHDSLRSEDSSSSSTAGRGWRPAADAGGGAVVVR